MTEDLSWPSERLAHKVRLERQHAPIILRYLYRDTRSSERAAMVMDYFLRIPNCYDRWHEVSYRCIGESLKLVRPRNIIHRVHYLRDRGHLLVRSGPNVQATNQYLVDRERILEDAAALPSTESDPIIEYMNHSLWAVIKSIEDYWARTNSHPFRAAKPQ